LKTAQRLFLFSAITILLASAPRAQQAITTAVHKPFHASAQSKFVRACGSNINEHTQCGDCVRVGGSTGPAVTKATTCDHICVQLPAGKNANDVNVFASAANDRLAPSWLPCGNAPNAPAVCAIGFAQFEGVEFYKDTNKLCGRFKNWSSDQQRIFRIVVDDK
jgi:hypothetical protein